jgi:hypothetical protein
VTPKRKPIGTYPTSGGGAAAYDKEGRAWRISAEEAAQIDAEIRAGKAGAK